MKKRIKVLFLFVLLFVPNIVLADADDTKCSNVIDTLDSYKVSVSKLESIDCENAVITEDIKECNKNSLNRSLSLSKLMQYNDSMPECINSEIENIIKENENSCTGVFDSSLKKLTNNYLKIFYIIAPFLLIIFGSVDLFKILAMTSTEMANKSKKDLRKRVIAFVLLYLTPMMVNFIISLNGSDYNLSGNAYVCKNNVYYEKGEAKYIGLAQVSQRFLSNININSLTGKGSSSIPIGAWHNDWFQGDERWGSIMYGSDTMAESACGSLATSIVCAHYKNDDSPSSYCYPPNTAKELESKGYVTYRSSYGIVLFFNEWHKDVGVKVSNPVYLDDANFQSMPLDELDAVLARGGACIADYEHFVKYDGRSVWTNGGHYITIIAGNQRDGYRVADSNGFHETGGGGISEWAPYREHVFEAKYIAYPWYYYFIEKVN